MKNFLITKSKRVRSTPFSSRIEEQGVSSYSVYNHMLLPTSFKSFEEEYFHLKKDVQIWDVSVQREIEISGPDSSKLVQLMTCRDLSDAKLKKCYYSPLIDKKGNLINDPVIFKINDSKWRVSIADSDVILYAKGIAETKNFNLEIEEAKVYTIAVQGPKSKKLMEKVFGYEIANLKFFSYDFFNFDGVKHLISKSGYSKQSGYEIHIENVKSGLKLYDHFFAVGKEFNVKPGCPNIIERIESGLLSYGNDMDNNDNPYECGFEKYVNLDSNIDFLGKEALKKVKKEGIKKKLMGVKIEIDQINLTDELKLHDTKNNEIGYLRSAVFSPSLKKVVGIAMIKIDYCNDNQHFKVNLNNKTVSGRICNLPIV